MTAAKRIARGGVMTALAMIFSYVEVLIPINIGIPGAKLGLANLIVMIGLCIMPAKEVFCISFARVMLTGLLFGNLASIGYSLAGALVSFALMVVLRKRNLYSLIGISIVGGVSHNVAQLMVAMFVVESINLIYYLPFLIILGAIAGLLVGIVGNKIVHLIKRTPIEH